MYKSTYTSGYSLKATTAITKNDIICLCSELNSRYTNGTTFEPEPITEGGIKFIFKDNSSWYKSVRLRLCNKNKWPWITATVMNDWKDNTDILLHEQDKITLFLKSFHGAPVFTIEELQLWEECFNKIGLVTVGKYPTKNSLSCEFSH